MTTEVVSDGRYSLTERERSAFQERGYTPVYPHPLLRDDPTFGERVVAEFRAFEKQGDLAYPGPTHLEMERKLDEGRMWFQSTFTALPALYSLGSHPAIVDRVKSVLGPDVLLWGATVLPKEPGQIHCWHTDTANWETIGAWIGIKGINRGSVLRLLSHTHRLGVSPYDIFTTGEWTDARGESALADDALVEGAARKLAPQTEFVVPTMEAGDFFILDAQTWHGSRNVSDENRIAITFFYARPDADIRIPTAFGKTPFWYRERPPCVLVSGVDRFHKNKIVPPAVASA